MDADTLSRENAHLKARLAEVEKALEAKGDFAFTVNLEVLPSFELADLSADRAFAIRRVAGR